MWYKRKDKSGKLTTKSFVFVVYAMVPRRTYREVRKTKPFFLFTWSVRIGKFAYGSRLLGEREKRELESIEYSYEKSCVYIFENKLPRYTGWRKRTRMRRRRRRAWGKQGKKWVSMYGKQICKQSRYRCSYVLWRASREIVLRGWPTVKRFAFFRGVRITFSVSTI